MTRDPAPVIRPRSDADLPALAELLIEVHEQDGYPVLRKHASAEWLGSGELLQAWVATIEGKPVGHVALNQLDGAKENALPLWTTATGRDADELALIVRLFVVARARGHRLGQRLTELATAHAREIGRRAVLEVLIKDTGAIRTYEALGWHRVGRFTHVFPNGASEDAYAYISPTQPS